MTEHVASRYHNLMEVEGSRSASLYLSSKLGGQPNGSPRKSNRRTTQELTQKVEEALAAYEQAGEAFTIDQLFTQVGINSSWVYSPAQLSLLTKIRGVAQRLKSMTDSSKRSLPESAKAANKKRWAENAKEKQLEVESALAEMMESQRRFTITDLLRKTNISSSWLYQPERKDLLEKVQAAAIASQNFPASRPRRRLQPTKIEATKIETENSPVQQSPVLQSSRVLATQWIEEEIRLAMQRIAETQANRDRALAELEKVTETLKHHQFSLQALETVRDLSIN